MPSGKRRPTKPSSMLRSSRLLPGSKEVSWVLRELERERKSRLQMAQADLQVTLKAGRERRRLTKSHGTQASESTLAPHAQKSIVPPSERSLKRDLAAPRSALVPELKRQQARITAIKRHPEAFDTIIGDPSIAGYIGWADSVTVDSRPFAFEGHLDVIPTSPIVRYNTPFVNTVRFAAVASSPVGYQAEMAWLALDTAHVFSFESWLLGSCGLTAYFLPNAVFRLDAPEAVWFFPFWHAVPHARLRFSFNLRVDHWLPASQHGDPPTQTVSNVFLRPTDELSGWGGPKSVSGMFAISPHFMSVPPFVVNNGSRIVITAQYHVDMFAMEGGSVTFDALSSPDWGLNVSHVEVLLNY